MTNLNQEDIANFSDRRPILVQRLQGFFHAFPSAIPMLVLSLAIIVFGVLLGSKFFSPFALTLVLQQVAIVGFVSVAQTLVVLTAGIDLSVGAIMVLSSVIMGQFTFRYGVPPALSVMLGLSAGALIGAINGILVAKIKLPPFIATLGVWQIALAANFLYSSNETIRAQDIATEAPLFHFFGNSFEVGGAVVTYGVVAMILLVAVVHFALVRTAWGRHVFAVGDDPDAASLAGVRADRILISVYALSGLICGFAGWVMIGRLGSVSPTSGQFTNIESITAVVIGGASLFGGRGSVVGSLFGAMIVGVFSLGLRLLGADPQWTFLMIGVLIIAAVSVDQWARRVSA